MEKIIILNNIPKGYRIRKVLEFGKFEKYIVESKFLGLWWIKEEKLAINVDTSRNPQTTYYDRVGRGYDIIMSDGGCRTYNEALEFIKYKPLKPFMHDRKGGFVFEMWSNNRTAINFVGANSKGDHYTNRIGLFFSNHRSDSHFEPKGEFWESFFADRYKMYKIVA